MGLDCRRHVWALRGTPRVDARDVKVMVCAGEMTGMTPKVLLAIRKDRNLVFFVPDSIRILDSGEGALCHFDVLLHALSVTKT